MPPPQLQSQPPVRPPNYRGELLAAIDDLPPLPRVLDRVLQLLNDSAASTGDIAVLIEKDSVLSGNVLRCVNSAYYGLPSRVTSIRHAVALLGFATVRNQAVAFSVRRLVKNSRTPPARLYARYGQHSLACAMLSERLAELLEVADAEAAFPSGLFHDIGKLLILATFPELLRSIVELFEQGTGDYEQAELEVLGLTHSQVSRMVLEKWKLPQCILQAVEYHHRPADAPAGSTVALADIVHAADLYVNELGLQMLPTKRSGDPSAEQALHEIGLAERMPAIVEQFKKEYGGLGSLF